MVTSIAEWSALPLVVAAYCGSKTFDDFRRKRVVIAILATICTLVMLAAGLWMVYASLAAYGV